MHLRIASRVLGLGFGSLLVLFACGSDPQDDDGSLDGGPGTFGDKGNGAAGPEGRDPYDCDEAKSSKSYVGCDYWPTITPNVVANSFNFTVVVANTGTKDAKITVTGPNSAHQEATVAPGALGKFALPWVSDLKGPSFTKDALPASPSTVVAQQGAYHLTSSSPVIVYQFNPLEFQAKNKDACAGDVHCMNSYSNDASLLLPSTAMRNAYRVMGSHGNVGNASVLSITATAAKTSVTVSLSGTAKVKASSGGQAIASANGGGKLTFTLASAGDVAQLVTPDDPSADFSGSLVQSDKPVQVITSVPCSYMPDDVGTCDHLEETVMPAEALGKKYVIAAPTNHDGKPGVHVVRIYGNHDNTKLTYSPVKPPECPDTVDAGKVADCKMVNKSFVVSGSSEFGIATFLVGSTYYGENETMGDPSQTTYAAVEQYRKRYLFLAPTDYPARFADVTAPEGTKLTLDGKTVDAPWEKIGNGPFGIFRVSLLASGQHGVHVIEANNPVGIEVLGYAYATSFEYPAGLNLDLIAPPPPLPK